jgi:hypothetical protein
MRRWRKHCSVFVNFSISRHFQQGGSAGEFRRPVRRATVCERSERHQYDGVQAQTVSSKSIIGIRNAKVIVPCPTRLAAARQDRARIATYHPGNSACNADINPHNGGNP